MTTPDDTVPPTAPPAKLSPAAARARQRADLLARVAMVCGQLEDSQIDDVIVYAELFLQHPDCPGTGRCHGAVRRCDRCDRGRSVDVDSVITCDNPSCRVHSCRYCGAHPTHPLSYDEVTHLGDCGCENPGVCSFCGALAMRSNGRICYPCAHPDRFETSEES
jgi:hypothetical protein